MRATEVFMSSKKYEARGVPLAEQDRPALLSFYQEVGALESARRAGVDQSTYLRAMAGGGLYAPQHAKLTAFARAL